MKFNQSILILAVVAISTTACKKEDPAQDGDPEEEKHMEITIESPQAGSTYAFDDIVSIQGTIHSNFDAHGYIIRYWNTSNNDSLLFEKDGHEHGEDIAFSASWTNNLSDTSDIRLEVIASSDHQGTYTETADVNVVCYP